MSGCSPIASSEASAKRASWSRCLPSAAAEIVHPLESYVWSPSERLALEVMSPPARLIERLLLDEDALDLFGASPMPQNWLLEPADPSGEDADTIAGVRALLRTSDSIRPADLASIDALPDLGGREDAESVPREVGEALGLESRVLRQQCPERHFARDPGRGQPRRSPSPPSLTDGRSRELALPHGSPSDGPRLRCPEGTPITAVACTSAVR